MNSVHVSQIRIHKPASFDFGPMPFSCPRHSPSIIPDSSHSCLAAHLTQQTIPACFRSVVFTSCGQTTLMSTTTCSLKQQSVSLRPLDTEISSFAHDKLLQALSQIFTFACCCRHLPPQRQPCFPLHTLARPKPMINSFLVQLLT